MVYSTMVYQPLRPHVRYMVSVAKNASQYGFFVNFDMQTGKDLQRFFNGFSKKKFWICYKFVRQKFNSKDLSLSQVCEYHGSKVPGPTYKFEKDLPKMPLERSRGNCNCFRYLGSVFEKY